jgi:hypothetical protein
MDYIGSIFASELPFQPLFLPFQEFFEEDVRLAVFGRLGVHERCFKVNRTRLEYL